MFKNIIFAVVGTLVALTLYILVTKPGGTVKEDTSTLIPKVTHISKEKIYQNIKEQKSKPKHNQVVKSNQNKKVTPNKEEKEVENNTQNTLPSEYKDFVPVDTKKVEVGEYEVSIVTDYVEKRDESSPPSVPYIISGKIKGKSFSITLSPTQVNRVNVVVVKDKNGNINTKEIPINDLANSGIVDIGNVASKDEDNEKDETSSQVSNSTGSIIPPTAPGI